MTMPALWESVARAIHKEYSSYERQPAWDDLHDESKECWYDLARVAIRAHNAALTQVPEGGKVGA